MDSPSRESRSDCLRFDAVGDGRLAGALLPEIDRLVIKLNPVVAGAGIALFGGAFDPTGFRLVETKAHDSGVLFLTYTRS
ncbi:MULTISPECIES: hypothetical protein [Actinoalloteichus]|uniref:hypothetical protein n=1 Tax=Actinoalloteichus TaxID=65496 RepID=UPI000479A48C|nr:hypothetical protein [Actinoalloteichus caeruleus]